MGIKNGFTYTTLLNDPVPDPHLLVGYRDYTVNYASGPKDIHKEFYAVYSSEKGARAAIAQLKVRPYSNGGYDRFSIFRINVEEDGYEMVPIDEVTIGSE